MTIRFGTDGWRGIIAADFTFRNVRAVAHAVAVYMAAHQPGKECLIGYDNRFLAPEMARAAHAALAEAGVPAVLADGPVPTPVLAFSVRHRQAGGAIMFTASHNPAAYQGMKFIPHYAGPATPEITAQLQATANAVAAEQAEHARVPQEVPEFDPAPDYWRHVEQIVDFAAIRRAGLRLGYDAMHGVGAEYMARLEPTVFLHRERDPLFGGMTPEPTGEFLSSLAAAVREHGLDLGLANDGDADRFGAVCPVAGFLFANQVLALLLWYLAEVKGRRGVVARTLATTHLLDRIAAGYGLESVETPVGFKYLAQVMLQEDVLIAGEESGGLSVGGHIPEKDGIVADLLLAEMRAVTGRAPGHLLADIAQRFGPSFTRRVDKHLHPGDRERLSARLNEAPPAALAGRRVVASDRRDGYKYRLDDGSWVLYRFSGTEPLVRVYGESGSAAGLAEVLAAAVGEVERA